MAVIFGDGNFMVVFLRLGMEMDMGLRGFVVPDERNLKIGRY